MNKAINLRETLLPPTLTLHGRKFKMRLASKDLIYRHQSEGYVLFTWKQLFDATKGKIHKTPQYPDATDPETKKGGNKPAEIRPNMFAMGIDWEILQERKRKMREQQERKRNNNLLSAKERMNKIARDAGAIPASGGKDIVRGETFADAERWAGVPEEKILKREKG